MNPLNLITRCIFVALSSTAFAQRAGAEVKMKTLQAPSFKSFKVKDTILSALSGGTSGVGGGGDDIALEFQQYSADAVRDMQPHSEFYKVLSEYEILKRSSEARIIIVDEALDIQTQNLIQNSVAANFPEENTILINRARWARIEDVRIKKAIVLHEVLSLQRIEQTGFYPISSKYLNFLGMSEKNLSTNLQVNRLQQLTAENPNEKAGMILKRFYDEARGSISLADIPLLDSALNGDLVCNQAGESASELGPFPTIIAVINPVILKHKESNGPLFPEHDEVREARIYHFDESEAYLLKKKGKAAVENHPIWERSTFLIKKDELLQTVPANPKGGFHSVR